MTSALYVIHEVIARRNVLFQLVSQQLILRYRRTIFGYLWTLINPLMMMSITAVVFANLFKADPKTYAILVFSGMVPWNCFSIIVSQSAGAFINNEGLIKKIYLPKALFPLSIAFSAIIDSVLSLGALFIIVLCLGGQITPALLFLPIAYLLIFIFSLGAGLMVAVITVFFRDVQHVIAIVLQALFFLTPLIYEKPAIKGKIAMLISLNPVAPFINLFRMPIRYGVVPPMINITHCILLATFSLLAGGAFFLKQERKIVFRL